MRPVSTPVTHVNQSRAIAPAAEQTDVHHLTSEIMGCIDSHDEQGACERIEALAAAIQLTAAKAGAKEAQPGIDALVNFAARDDAAGAIAQKLLCGLYVDHKDTRTQVLNTAHGLYRLAIANHANMSKSGSAGFHVSATVAYLGGRAPEEPDGPNGDGIKPDFCGYLADQVNAMGAERNQMLASRQVSDFELQAACAQLECFDQLRDPFVMPPDMETDACLANLAQLGGMVRDDAPLLVQFHSGDDSFQHFMCAFAVRHEGVIQWHVVNTAADTQGGTRVARRLGDALSNVFGKDCVALHQGAMQNDTHNSCGPLSFHFSKKVAAAIAARKPRAGEIGPVIDNAIEQAKLEWLNSGAAQRQAMDLTLRAELIQAASNKNFLRYVPLSEKLEVAD